MFGLLKSCTCNSSKKERDLKRLAYCGSCKALGSLYGQKSRFFLNHDATFLAELLLALRAEQYELAPALRSFNCMSIPAEADIPLELKLSASINLLLAEFKLLDQLEDSRGIVSEFAYRAFSENFAAAASLLSSLSFPVQKAFEWLKVQSAREAEPNSSCSSETGKNRLQHFAEATKEVTGLFFRHAALACSQEQSAENLEELGKEFGALIYILDALEDFDKDCRKQAFNGIASAYSTGLNLTASARKEVIDTLQHSVRNICITLSRLELEPQVRRQFQQRFRTNLKTRLAKLERKSDRQSKTRACTINKSARSADDTKIAGAAHEQSRVASAKLFANKITSQFTFSFPFAQFVATTYAFMFALIFSSAAEDAETIDDCLQMPFNLIVLSGASRDLFNFIARPLVPIFASIGFGGGSGMSGSAESPGRKKRCGCDGDCCDSDCCDCCNCGNYNCPSCDCAACDCSACDCSGCDCSACEGCKHCGSIDCCSGGECCHCGNVDCCAGGCDCGGCDCSACNGCDCGGCDCGGCDCGGCNCN